jgi:hypothetical protein
VDENSEPTFSPVKLKQLKEGVLVEDEEGKIVVGKKEIKHIEAANGDVFVLKQFPGLTTDLVDGVVRAISDVGLNDSIVVVVERLSDIKTLDEEQMEKHGWIRKPTG